ncbi:MAG: sulfatase, partial [Planctomycetota bacterium JB042]
MPRAHRRHARAVLFLLPLLTACSRRDGPPSDAEGTPAWNVVLLSIDTLRADHLGAYGATGGHSPRLDAFAATGVVFEQAIAQAPWTLPSHASMLASEYPSALDVGTYSAPRPVHENARLLGEVLRDEGYRTYAVTGGGYVSSTFGLDQGFEAFEERLARTDADRMFGIGTAWLDGLGDAGPFFLFLHTFEVHAYDPPEEILRELWADGAPESPLRRKKELAKYLQTARNHAEIEAFTAEDWRCAIDRYDGALRSVDRAFGAFLDGLEERGLLEETLIVVTSDHGEEHGEHGAAGHGYNLHDENVRVPLLVGHPDLPTRRVGTQVRLLDVAPTVVDLLGIEPPEEWKGTTLVPAIAGEELSLKAFSESAHVDLKALRDGDLKYVLSLWERREHLYDLEYDPVERIDLGADRPDDLASRRAAMALFVRETASVERYRGGADAVLSEEKQRE